MRLAKARVVGSGSIPPPPRGLPGDSAQCAYHLGTTVRSRFAGRLSGAPSARPWATEPMCVCVAWLSKECACATHHVDETCTHRLPENDSYVVAVLVGTAAATMCVMMVVVVPRCATLMLPNHMRNGHQGAPDSAIQTMRRSHLRLFDVQTNVQAPSGAM